MVEHLPEEQGVEGSIPSGDTMRPFNNYGGKDTPIVLILDDYEAANLHWLLRVALISPNERKDLNLNTGDWNGQILWQLEHAIIDKINILKQVYADPEMHNFHYANGEYPKGSISIKELLELGPGHFR